MQPAPALIGKGSAIGFSRTASRTIRRTGPSSRCVMRPVDLIGGDLPCTGLNRSTAYAASHAGSERLWPHHERVPGATWQHPAERRQQQPAVRLEPRLVGLAAKDRQLVAKHENLKLLLPIATSEQRQLDQPARNDVQR
jgi:hypothetical protein